MGSSIQTRCLCSIWYEPGARRLFQLSQIAIARETAALEYERNAARWMHVDVSMVLLLCLRSRQPSSGRESWWWRSGSGGCSWNSYVCVSAAFWSLAWVRSGLVHTKRGVPGTQLTENTSCQCSSACPWSKFSPWRNSCVSLSDSRWTKMSYVGRLLWGSPVPGMG